MPSNITTLRKAGNLDAAYKLAKEAFDLDPDDIWNRRNLAWVYHDYAKRTATVQTKDKFLRCIDKLIELDMPQDEEFLHNGAMFLLRGMAATMIRAEKEDNAFFDVLMDRAKQLKTKKRTLPYSALMNVMLRAKNWWRGFKDFCKWWGIETGFMDDDFKSPPLAARSTNDVSSDGPKMMPLAEKTVMAYCKCLLDSGSVAEIVDFLPWLDTFAAQHRNYIYLPFYHAKLLWKIGLKDQYFVKMKIFARKKSGEFWVWDLLGDYYDDHATRLKFYAKGLLCRTKPEMSVKLREKTANLLRQLGHLPEALYEYHLVAKIRERNKWRTDNALLSTIREIESQGVAPSKDNSAFFGTIADGVEQMVFGTRPPKKTQLSAAVQQPDSERTAFEGRLTLSPGGYGFVRHNGKTIFVPQQLAAAHNLTDKSMVKGLFVKSIDKKKGKEGFKAVKIEIKCK